MGTPSNTTITALADALDALARSSAAIAADATARAAQVRGWVTDAPAPSPDPVPTPVPTPTDWVGVVRALPNTVGCRVATLTKRSGRVTCAAGETLRGQDITGYVEVLGNNWTIEDCIIRVSGAAWGLYGSWKYSGGKLNRVTVIGGADACLNLASPDSSRPVVGTDLLLKTGAGGDGWKWGSNVDLSRVVASAPAANPGAGEHVDIGGQVMSARNLTLRYCYIDGVSGATSGLMIRADTGPVDNVLVEYVVIDDGNVSQPAIYADQATGQSLTRCVIRHVRVKRGAWGSLVRQAGGVTLDDVAWS